MFGFSLEVLLKGIIYHRQPRYIFNGKIDHAHDRKNPLPHLKHHNITVLFDLIGENLSREEVNFCEFLVDKMINYRYPVPFDMRQMNKQPIIMGDFFAIYNGLYDRLAAIADLYSPTGHLK